MVNGISSKNLNPLQPGDSISTDINLFPLFPGLQSISGLRIIEQQFDKSFDFDQLVDIFVQSPSN